MPGSSSLEKISARVVQVASIAQGEYAENQIRKDYSPSERVAIVETLRCYTHGGDRKSDQARDRDVDRLTVRAAAALVGDTKDDYYRAKKVVEHGVPALVEARDSGRLSVYAASLVAEAPPGDQERVIAKGGKEEDWAAKGVRKQLRRSEREREREDAGRRRITAPESGDKIRLYHCPFQRLEEVAGIAPGSVGLFCTDIPYDEEFLNQLPELAAMAVRTLTEGGLFVTYSGHLYLNRVLKILDEHLDYGWARCSRWVGVGNICFPRQVTSKWKPIVVYSKGAWRERDRWNDYTLFEGKEKGWHEWQQPLGEVEQLIRDFSEPGGLVVDPCGGGFTTSIACHLQGRRCISCDSDAASVIRGPERLALCRSNVKDVPRPPRPQAADEQSA